MAVPPLRALVGAGHDVALCVTRPDRRRGRGKEETPSPVKVAATELGIAVTHDMDDLTTAGVELAVVVAYGRIIPVRLLEQIPMVNLHFSLLPRWRGAAPVERAILAGEDGETAERCLDAGAGFVTSTGFVPEVLEATLRIGAVAIPGALTPTEVIAAWKGGAHFVKIYPTEPVGGDLYIRSLKVPLPQIKLIAAGGVNQQNAARYIQAGATAIGVGVELLPKDAVMRRQNQRIQELARRFLRHVSDGRTAV